VPADVVSVCSCESNSLQRSLDVHITCLLPQLLQIQPPSSDPKSLEAREAGMHWLAGQASKAGVGDSVEGALGVLEGKGVECSSYSNGSYYFFYVPVSGVSGEKRRVSGASAVLRMLNLQVRSKEAQWQRLLHFGRC